MRQMQGFAAQPSRMDMGTLSQLFGANAPRLRGAPNPSVDWLTALQAQGYGPSGPVGANAPGMRGAPDQSADLASAFQVLGDARRAAGAGNGGTPVAGFAPGLQTWMNGPRPQLPQGFQMNKTPRRPGRPRPGMSQTRGIL